MRHIVTGVAGFIGYHVAERLLGAGVPVTGLDNLNEYYSVELKKDRLARLARHRDFSFHQVDLADKEALKSALAGTKFNRMVHLAAQAGVRHSLENPDAYVHSNLVGHVNVLELCRHHDALEATIYASSSSVYGGNTKIPFSESDRVENPVSLYAATKRADELLCQAYANMYRMPLIGLRFFTVYGPWGRPDMALWLFTEAILAGRPIKVFNRGRMRRDFTFIDDVADGMMKIIADPLRATKDAVPHRIYNMGNSRPEELIDVIGVLEKALGRPAQMEMLPMQTGDVIETYADIDAIRRDYGFDPSTPITEGIPAFVDWYRAYHGR